MQSLQRKPRVFLSHSKKDVDFIRRLENDLRSCGCETWIDEIEIRHGKPWLDEIFSSGIPSCEIVLCYITQNSLQSAMVKKEIDARVIEHISNSHVTLLLYIAEASLRNELRVDLQALQTPVLNDETYTQLLPRIVAEIWRSFTEIASGQALQNEKIRRLELELRLKEIEAASTSGIFSQAEQAEFQAIWKQIDVTFETIINASSTNRRDISNINCVVNYGKLYRQTICTEKFMLSLGAINRKIGIDCMELLPTPNNSTGMAIFDARQFNFRINYFAQFDYEAQLLRFGFLTRIPQQVQKQGTYETVGQKTFELVFTDKFDRFNFWLDNQFGPIPKNESVVIEIKNA